MDRGFRRTSCLIFSTGSTGLTSERSAREGLGLGLFIAREIVNAHGGRIEVASTLGSGATFTVRLPLLDASESR